jgi:general secretion pathway protein I
MHREGSRGFTLIEVLVAFTVLALTLAALLQVFSTGLRTTAAAHDYVIAASLAQGKLAALGAAEPIVSGRQAGRFDNGFQWSVEAEPANNGINGPEAPLARWLVSVTVRGGDARRPAEVTLNTLRLLPASPPSDRP